jgi:RNA polymerase sigma factor (TIGR02999 family)
MGNDDVTMLLRAIGEGDREALDRLIPLVYPELRALAARQMNRERKDHTLQPTALVNEAYLRLVDRREPSWESRAHFLGAASQVIRRVLVEHARARKREKRGGDALKVTLSDDPAGDGGFDLDLLALDEALDHLGEEHPDERRAVELRYFGGLSVPEAAKVLGVSTRTVERHWTFARAWLFRELGRGAGSNPGGGCP